ncbi:hypothetical protein ACFJGW_10785 [Burkholderiaceae bacterium UC74_6]
MNQRIVVWVVAFACGLAGGGIGAAVVVNHYGDMPNNWAQWSQVAPGTKPGASNALGGVVGQVSLNAMPTGGPQGLEGYVYIKHPEGKTRLAIGTIGNVEVAGTGSVTEIRSMQAGGIVSGTGHVDKWVGILLAHPGGQHDRVGSYHPIVSDDPSGQTVLRGSITTDAISFSNGWSLHVQGDSLELTDAGGKPRQLFEPRPR